jgi:hypothetical protein
MRSVPWFMCALLAFAAPAALAGGVDLTWGTGCYPENPQTLRTFACNTNTGSASMVASFLLSTDAPQFVGIQATVRLEAQATAIPDWWQFFNAGTCRTTALSTSADFTAAPQQACSDPWAGQAGGGVTSYITGTSLNPPATGWLRLAYAVPGAVPLFHGVEYYAFRATVTFAKTVGTGACAGCTVPVLLVLDDLRSSQSNQVTEDCTTPIANACIDWQAGSGCQIVPVRNLTWGRVQSLYR